MADSAYRSKADWTANFKHEKHRAVGHLEELTVGGEKLEPGYNFPDPMNPGETVPLVGTIDFLDWEERLPGKPLIFEGLMNSGNQGILNYAIESRDISADCEFKLSFYAYDLKAKTYFKCFHTDGQAIKGQLTTDNRSSADKEISDEYQQIASHRYTLSILGSDELEQLLHVAYLDKKIKTFRFGGKVGA